MIQILKKREKYSMAIKFPMALRVIGKSIRDWWDGWLDMVMMTAVWFFAQLTVVLGPPATFGMFYSIQSYLNGQSLGVRGMIEGARKYFWKALLWGVINLAVIATFFVNFNFYANVQAAWGLYLLVFVGLLAFLWVGTNFYGLAYFFEQDVKSLKVALRNGILTTLASPVYTLILLIPAALIVGLTIWIVLPLFLGLPALIPVLGLRGVNERLETFGLRQPEPTPKEIEMAERDQLNAPGSSNLPMPAEPAATEPKTQGRRK